MRTGLTLLIRAYWRLWPVGRRRSCLYRESCSTHVYRVAESKGLVAGLRALHRRYKSCRPGYVIQVHNGALRLALADGSVLPLDEASTTVSEPVRHALGHWRRGLDATAQEISTIPPVRAWNQSPRDNTPARTPSSLRLKYAPPRKGDHIRDADNAEQFTAPPVVIRDSVTSVRAVT